jgi:hypothetical protein
MQNGNKVTKKNWYKVYDVSNRPDISALGYPEIEKIKKEKGAYYDRWELKFEEEDDRPAGFIFREINHNGGISGRHATFKEAIWWAMSYKHISVFLSE